MKALQNKTIVITGGTRGFGLGIAQACVDEGGAVVIASRSADSVQRALAQLSSQGGQVSGIACDIRKPEQVQALADHALARFGRLDVWVNNAGLSCPTGPTAHIPTHYVVDLIETNILGTYHGSLIAMRHFLGQGAGKLINIVGKGDRKPIPLHNPYASSRAWVNNFTLALAQEYQDSGVGIFLLNPGLIDTDITRHLHFIRGYESNIKVFNVVFNLFAKPPEVPAKRVVWLASSATDNRTGLRINMISTSNMLRDILHAGLGRIRGRKAPPLDVKISIIEPAIEQPFRDIGRHAGRRGIGEKGVGVMTQKFIYPLAAEPVIAFAGNKAVNLRLLCTKKFQVPKTYVCSWQAYEKYLSEGASVLERVRVELEGVLDDRSTYAIRSSANVEDSLDNSFAGQFRTILEVTGLDRVIEAIQEVWDSAQSEAVSAYLQKTYVDRNELKMAVMIQEMIQPVLSGVAFSKNPLTAQDEIVVEAVRGSGIALVQDGVTPLRWVNKWGNWIVQSDGRDDNWECIQEVVDQTKKIARLLHRDVDLEWVHDGRQLYWLQLRDITSIGSGNVYSNKIAKEMTPGQVKPLVWSVVVPVKGKVWVDIIAQVTAKEDIDPGSLARAFYYRAYHNIGVFGKVFESLGLPRESLEIMMGVAPPGTGKPPFKPRLKIIRLLPRLMGFLYDKWTFSTKIEADYPRHKAWSKEFTLDPSPDLSKQQLIEIINRIIHLNQEVSYYAVLTILLMQIYNGLLRSRLKTKGVDFQQFDLTDGMEELERYNPGDQFQALNRSFKELDSHIQERIRKASYAEFCKIDGIEEFQGEVATFLEQFGHMSDTTGEFDKITWRENPEMILQMIATYEKHEGASQAKIRFDDLHAGGLSKRLLRLFYQRARQFRLYREMYSSLYTYTMMLLRIHYLAVGDRLVQDMVLSSAEDIYYLYDDEIRSYVDGHCQGEEFAELVIRRKDEMELSKDAVLPEVIYGDDLPPVFAPSIEKLSGIPTSRGYYTGKVKVVRGLGDINKLEHGDVLVIPFSDVGWIPLFAKAGAVIAESGGILSHSSIIAREYNIPAVVSVSGALSLQDETLVSIDGFKGEILVHDDF